METLNINCTVLCILKQTTQPCDKYITAYKGERGPHRPIVTMYAKGTPYTDDQYVPVHIWEPYKLGLYAYTEKREGGHILSVYICTQKEK